MPLVFVHGVNNRRGDTEEEQQVFDNWMALLAENLRTVAFVGRVQAPDGLTVFTPYWGDLGVTFRKNLACLPHGDIEALAIGQPERAPLLRAAAANLDAETLRQKNLRNEPLLTLARTRSLGAAVDLLFAGGANAPVSAGVLTEEETRQARRDAASFAHTAVRYAKSHPRPAWVSAVSDDEAFVSRLVEEVAKESATAASAVAEGTEALGIGSTLRSWLDNAAAAVRSAVGSVADAATSAVTDVATEATRRAFLWLSESLRPTASTFVGRFFGDVFKYLEDRKPIVDRVLAAVAEAENARREGDQELYLVGHSFGGIILYDVLSHFRRDLSCDLFVTVGSQVALFAELERLADKQGLAAGFGSQKGVVPRPPAAQRWLNVFDPTDLVGFGTRDVFAGARDFQFETEAMPIISHSAYFDSPRFFDRLQERINDAFENGTG